MRYDSRRHSLRALTKDAHSLVDATVGSFETPVDYARYLKGQYIFRLGIEAALAQVSWPASFGDWQFRPLAPLLRADLDDLGVEPPPAPAPPALAPQDLLGVLYVLEGSGLGARVLYRRAREIGFDAGFGARHLAAQAEDHASWPGFLSLLESAQPFEMERTVSASLATFAAAGAAFERRLDVVG